ncbi:kinesin-like protein KIF12 isoform X2 [Protopterus annectens]|uniref:kinesin-like protein KIF12 isoform X2 n=1 Tax=Protopterus annectens TaxID=7888 RepID=UPI001CF963B8|nr:kinesin-like protein KIF12 isoform X2 [Protopterus annectens]
MPTSGTSRKEGHEFLLHKRKYSNASETPENVKESNVSVVVRVRPLNKAELSRGENAVVHCPGQGTILVSKSASSGSQEKAFAFSTVFGPEAQQYEIFEYSGVKRLIDLSIQGYSCTLFAFGQTGSGKTFTIMGPQQMCDTQHDQNVHGLIQRSFVYLLEKIRSKAAEVTLNASYIEIYNEQVRDLLNSKLADSLPLRWSKTRGFYVENLITVEFGTIESIMSIVREGTKNRQTSSHTLNDNSSRSHSILTIYVKSEVVNQENSAHYLTKHGKLCFVDLAGSEKVKKTGSTGELMMEANNINCSLLTLGNCISALVDSKRKDGHIPYRDSKLTKLLADSLGGSGVTLMIACISPSIFNLQETLNTLRYASRARKIKNRPMARMDPKGKLVLAMEQEIRRLKTENVFLRQQLSLPPIDKQNCESESKLKKSAYSLSESSTESEDPPRKSILHPDPGLYGMLQEFLMENESLRQENNQVLNSRDSIRQEMQSILWENSRLFRKLGELERVMSSSPAASSHSLIYSDSISGNLSLPLSLCSGYCPAHCLQVTNSPPLEPFLNARGTKHVICQSNLQQQEVQHHMQQQPKQSCDSRLFNRKTSQIKHGNYVNHFQIMKESKSQRSEEKAQEKVIPSAPPLDLIPVYRPEAISREAYDRTKKEHNLSFGQVIEELHSLDHQMKYCSNGNKTSQNPRGGGYHSQQEHWLSKAAKQKV